MEVAPEFLPAHFALLSALMNQDQLDEASKLLLELKRIAGRHPHTTIFGSASRCTGKKDFKLAKDLTQRSLARRPRTRAISELAGAIELQLNALPQAEAYLSSALKAAPDLRWARRLLVATHLRSGQAAKAIAALQAGDGGKEIDPSLFSLAGQAYLQNGDTKRAEEYFARALKLDPNYAEQANRTGASATSPAARPRRASTRSQNIAGADSGISADLALISAHLRRQEFDKALAAVAKLEAKQPGQAIGRRPARPHPAGAARMSPAARASFEQTLKIDPSYFAGSGRLATLDMAEKKPDEARQRFERLLVANPKNSPACSPWPSSPWPAAQARTKSPAC